MATGSCSHKRVEISRSVNKNVTVPEGNSAISPPAPPPQVNQPAQIHARPLTAKAHPAPEPEIRADRARHQRRKETRKPLVEGLKDVPSGVRRRCQYHNVCAGESLLARAPNGSRHPD